MWFCTVYFHSLLFPSLPPTSLLSPFSCFSSSFLILSFALLLSFSFRSFLFPVLSSLLLLSFPFLLFSLLFLSFVLLSSLLFPSFSFFAFSFLSFSFLSFSLFSFALFSFLQLFLSPLSFSFPGSHSPFSSLYLFNNGQRIVELGFLGFTFDHVNSVSTSLAASKRRKMIIICTIERLVCITTRSRNFSSLTPGCHT